MSQTVTVKDYLIVAIGDSVSSGEGNPEVLSSNSADNQWQTGVSGVSGERCHRSWMAGASAAALRLEDEDPLSTVTFVHLGCSGAKIADPNPGDGTADGGLLHAYEGFEAGSPPLPPQLQQIKEILDYDPVAGTRDGVPDRQIDALLVNAGANDAGFSDIVKSCLLEPSCHTGNAASIWQTRSATLFSRFSELRDAMLVNDGDPLYLGNVLTADRVYVMGYHDPTRDDDGTVCDPLVSLGPADVVSKAEADWASNTVVSGLNSIISSAAAQNGWRFVGSIPLLFKGAPGHGYCANNHFIVQFGESSAQQGDVYGAMHPNALGHGVIRDELLKVLKPGLAFERPAYAIKAEIPPPRPKIWGFADLHNHQFANLGFGGLMNFGNAFDTCDFNPANDLQN
ncbi:MAG: hypothetical protein ACREUU_11665, partial [Gammaproteobacteria bacterium]